MLDLISIHARFFVSDLPMTWQQREILSDEKSCAISGTMAITAAPETSPVYILREVSNLGTRGAQSRLEILP